MRRTRRGGWPYSQPPNVQFEINRASPQADGLVLWMPWGGGTPGVHHHVDRVSGLVFTEGGTPVWVADGERGWAMLFDDVATEYLESDTAVVSGPPFSVSCQFNSNDDTITQFLIWLGDKDVADEWWALLIRGNVAGDPLRLRSMHGGAAHDADTTNGYIANDWHYAVGVIESSTVHHAILDGDIANKGSWAGAAALPVNLDRTTIARRGSSVPGAYVSGRVMDVRVYNRALTDTEVYQLYDPYTRWELYRPLLRRSLAFVPAPPPPTAALPIFPPPDAIHSQIFGGVTVR